MGNKLEQLLSSLIERGWKPYGIEKDDIEVFEYNKDRKNISIGYMNWISPSEGDYDWLFVSLRELVSKESGLWQFVCDNELYPRNNCNGARIYKANISQKFIEDKDYKYRLIVSSLKDESELEDFLLSNIKVNE